MASKNIAWNTGTGSITLEYNGQGNGTIQVTSSENNLNTARSQVIRVQTVDESKYVDITIRQAARQYIDISNAIVTAPNQTYNGTAKTPTVTVTLDGVVIASSNYDVSYSNNTNAGTATITVTGKGDYSGTATGSFTIAKANPTYTAPTAKSGLVYSGSAQTLLNAGSTSHGTIKYSTNNSTWSTSIPTSTNASNSIIVYWKLEGDSNHNDVSSTSITCSISKANRTLSFSSPSNLVTKNATVTNTATPSAGAGDGTISYSSSSTTLATVNSSGIVTGKSEGNVTITATISAGTNYNSATTSYKITVISYPTNGLVFYLDGILKGDDNSYWVDLAGNLKFPWANCTRNSNNVHMEGTGAMQVTSSKSFPSSSCTIEIAVETDTPKGASAFIFMPSKSSNVCAHVGTNSFQGMTNSSNTYSISTEDKLFCQTPSGCTINNRPAVPYDTDSWGTDNSKISVGGRGNGTRNYTGKIYSIRIYNRALSSSEIESNQSIDNTRFGLGIHIEQTYISNGLVFQLDGINKGTDSNNWTDLIGGLKFPYNNCTKGTNCVTFNGTGCTKATSSASFSQTTHTIEAACDFINVNQVLVYPSAVGNIMLACSPYSSNAWRVLAYGSATAYRYFYRETSLDGSIYKLLSINENLAVMNYGARDKTDTTDNWGAQIDGTLKIGGRNTDRFYSGNVYAIRIYNRKLTKLEMVQNQRLDNMRFNLNAICP